ERQIEPLCWCLDKTDDLGDQLFECMVTTDQLRFRKAILQGVHQYVGIIAELDRAHALVGRRHQDRTERTLADREPDHIAVPAGSVLRRRHAKKAVGRRIETAIGVEPRTINRLRYRLAAPQLLAHAFTAARVGVGFWRDPGDRFEHAMEMVSA